MEIIVNAEGYDLRLEIQLRTREAISHKLMSEDERVVDFTRRTLSDAGQEIVKMLAQERYAKLGV